MQNGMRRKRRTLSPEEKWQVFLEVTTGQLSQSDCARQWGVDVIGMTNLPEAKLAREASLCYATLALVTDFDCWHPGHDAVTVEAVIATLHRNVALSREIIRTAVPVLAGARPCACERALETAVITAPAAIPAAARKRLALLLGPPPAPHPWPASGF